MSSAEIQKHTATTDSHPSMKQPTPEQKELQKSLKPLQEKLKLFEQIQGNFGQTAEHVNVQEQQTEGRIKEQFKKLHTFLEEEEKAGCSDD